MPLVFLSAWNSSWLCLLGRHPAIFRASVLTHLLYWALCLLLSAPPWSLPPWSSLLPPPHFTLFSDLQQPSLTIYWIYLFKNRYPSLRTIDGLVSFTLMAHDKCSKNIEWIKQWKSLRIHRVLYYRVDISKVHVCAQVYRYGWERLIIYFCL